MNSRSECFSRKKPDRQHLRHDDRGKMDRGRGDEGRSAEFRSAGRRRRSSKEPLRTRVLSITVSNSIPTIKSSISRKYVLKRIRPLGRAKAMAEDRGKPVSTVRTSARMEELHAIALYGERMGRTGWHGWIVCRPPRSRQGNEKKGHSFVFGRFVPPQGPGGNWSDRRICGRRGERKNGLLHIFAGRFAGSGREIC